MRNGPPGMRTRSFGLIFQYRKLQLALVGVNSVEEHAHAIADGKLAARALAHDLADVLLISVLVAGQSATIFHHAQMSRGKLVIGPMIEHDAGDCHATSARGEI